MKFNSSHEMEKWAVDIERRLDALKRIIEGNAADPSDWMANSRMSFYTYTNSENISISTDSKPIISEQYYTGGGRQIGFVTVTGSAVNAGIYIYAAIDDEIIYPQCVFYTNGIFCETFVFVHNVQKGMHTLSVKSRTYIGAASVKPGDARVLLFAPGNKF